MPGIIWQPELWQPDPLNLRAHAGRLPGCHEYGYGHPCCCFDGSCIRCTGETPERLELVIADAANSTCVGCANTNGTFACRWTEPRFGFNTCQWDSPSFSSVCTGEGGDCEQDYIWRVVIGIFAGQHIYVQLFPTAGGAAGVTIFQKDQAAPFDCDALSDLDIPYIAEFNCDAKQACDFSGATATLSAL